MEHLAMRFMPAGSFGMTFSTKSGACPSCAGSGERLPHRIAFYRVVVKNARVVELPDSNHYVFIRDEALVVREMRKFLVDE
jgi:hypothetical protein